MKENIYVFYGGESVEHDISIITAMQVLKVRPDLLPIYIDRRGVMYVAENLDDVKIYSNFEKLAKGKKEVTFVTGKPLLAVKRGRKYGKVLPIAFALLCTHGKFGEDGELQGILESCHIPYSSSNNISSALCMDKIFMKDVFAARDLPSVKSYPLVYEDYLKNKGKVKEEIRKRINFPVILKPARLGSSIGIKVCEKIDDLEDDIEFCAKFDNRILVEKFLPDIEEFNCACLYMNDYVVSDVQKVESHSKIYSFEEKYLNAKEVKDGENLQAERSQKDIKKGQSCKATMNEFSIVERDVFCEDDDKLGEESENSFVKKDGKLRNENIEKIANNCGDKKENSQKSGKNDKKIDKKVKNFDKNLKKQIKSLTLKVYKIFNCFGVVRVDFIYDKQKQKLYINELNNIPGSLAFYLFKDLKFKDLITCLIEEGKQRKEKEQFVSAYDSEALAVFEKLNLNMIKK